MKVSVLIVTYNHEKYIARSIESALMQRTDFDYEILIGEDASTDGTRAVCEDYARRFPERIRLFVNPDPQDKIFIFGKPTGRKNLLNIWRHARGTYVALLEGDDYWTDPEKLQVQVAFLESRPQYSLCYHRVETEGTLADGNLVSQKRQKGSGSFVFSDSLRRKHGATVSMVFRNLPGLRERFEKTSLGTPAGDWPLECLLTTHGQGFFMDRVMATYDRLPQGATHLRLRNKGEFLLGRLSFLKALLQHGALTPEQARIVQDKIVLFDIAYRNYKLVHDFDLRALSRQFRLYLENYRLFGTAFGRSYTIEGQFRETLLIPAVHLRRWGRKLLRSMNGNPGAHSH